MNERPASLTDDQMAALMRYAAPLSPHDRDQFVRESVTALSAMPDQIGYGSIARVCATIQAKYASRVIGSTTRLPTKYSRSNGSGRKR